MKLVSRAWDADIRGREQHQSVPTTTIVAQAMRAGQNTLIFRQADPLCADTHPADLPCRIADHQREISDRPNDHSACADKGIPANCDAANDCGIGADGGIVPDQGLDQRVADFLI